MLWVSKWAQDKYRLQTLQYQITWLLENSCMILQAFHIALWEILGMIIQREFPGGQYLSMWKCTSDALTCKLIESEVLSGSPSSILRMDEDWIWGWDPYTLNINVILYMKATLIFRFESLWEESYEMRWVECGPAYNVTSLPCNTCYAYVQAISCNISETPFSVFRTWCGLHPQPHYSSTDQVDKICWSLQDNIHDYETWHMMKQACIAGPIHQNYWS